MDINDLRSLATLASFLCFIAICWWAYSGKSQKAFDEAANLPFNDPEEEKEQRKAQLLGRG